MCRLKADKIENAFQTDTSKSASMVRKKMAGLEDDYRSILLESGIKMRYTGRSQ